MKLLNLAVAVAVVNAIFIVGALADARECPTESDCIHRLCKDFRYDTKGPLGDGPVILQARCKNDAGEDIITSLDLANCIGNNDGELSWSDKGKQNCSGCRITQESEGKIVGLRCSRCPRKSAFFRGYTWSWINLSYGIWVKNGTMGCYQNTGSRAETLRTLQI